MRMCPRHTHAVSLRRRSIRVRAEGPGGVSPWVTAAVNISGTGGLPLQNAVLYLDATTLTATTRLTRWDDQSGRGNHFTQASTTYQPSVTGPKAGEPFSSILFAGGQYLTSSSMDFDVDLNNAGRRDMTVFVIYKPSSSSSSSAITGKGATWSVGACSLVRDPTADIATLACCNVAGTTAAAAGPCTRRSRTRGMATCG